MAILFKFLDYHRRKRANLLGQRIELVGKLTDEHLARVLSFIDGPLSRALDDAANFSDEAACRSCTELNARLYAGAVNLAQVLVYARCWKGGNMAPPDAAERMRRLSKEPMGALPQAGLSVEVYILAERIRVRTDKLHAHVARIAADVLLETAA